MDKSLGCERIYSTKSKAPRASRYQFSEGITPTGSWVYCLSWPPSQADFLVTLIHTLTSACKGWALVNLCLLKPRSASPAHSIFGAGEPMPERSLLPTECLWLPLSEKSRRSLEGTSWAVEGGPLWSKGDSVCVRRTQVCSVLRNWGWL